MRLAALCLGLALSIPAAAWADQASAIAAVRAQPRVIDATIDNGGNMYVSVKAEKLPWDQYAVQLCNLVRPHQARIFVIRIVDLTTVTAGKRPGDWKVFAQATCGKP
jgi:hypothetical protein